MDTPNYKETAVVGQKWTRARRVLIENPSDSPATILLVEEDVINIGDRKISELSGNLSTTFDPADPLHLAIYEKINELYVLLREARDAELAAQGGAA